jgi:hypothetical protein
LALVSDNKKILLKAAPYGLWCDAQITFSAWQTIGQRGLKQATQVRPEDLFGLRAQRRCSGGRLALSPTHETTA